MDPSITASKADKTDSTTITKAVLGLFFSRVDVNIPTTFEPCEIKTEAELLLSSKVITDHWGRLHATVVKKYADNHHFLASMISKSFQVQPPLLKRLIKGQIIHFSISTLMSTDSFDHELFLIHFASPTTPTEFQNQQFYAKRTREEEDSTYFGQPINHQVRIATKLHIFHSFCDSIDTILANIANFLTVAEGFVPVHEWGVSSLNPAIVNFFHELASLLSDADARARISNLARIPQFNHLYFSIFSCFQDIFASFGSINRTTIAVDLIVLQKPENIDKDLFRDTIATYQRSLTTITDLVRLGMTANLASAPVFFSIIFPPFKPKKYDSKKEDPKEPVKRKPRVQVTKHQREAKGNWLLCVDRHAKFRDFHFPDKVGTFCLCFAIKNLTCKKRLDCPNPHVDYSAWTSEQQDAFKAYLTTNPAYKLAE